VRQSDAVHSYRTFTALDLFLASSNLGSEGLSRILPLSLVIRVRPSNLAFRGHAFSIDYWRVRELPAAENSWLSLPPNETFPATRIKFPRFHARRDSSRTFALLIGASLNIYGPSSTRGAHSFPRVRRQCRISPVVAVLIEASAPVNTTINQGNIRKLRV
jgi:hypothetical protein